MEDADGISKRRRSRKLLLYSVQKKKKNRARKEYGKQPLLASTEWWVHKRRGKRLVEYT
jgi:hypothetical protein